MQPAMDEQVRLEDPVAQIQLPSEAREGLRLQLQQLSRTSTLYSNKQPTGFMHR